MQTRAVLSGFLMTLALLLVSCGEIGLERLPTPTAGFEPIPSIKTPLGPGETAQPALLERRLLILEWPKRILEKDSGLIFLTLTMDESGMITPTVQAPDDRSDGTPIDIPNLYDTHNIIAVARLDMAGLEAYRESIREPLRPGNPVTFRWSVRANEAGMYRGVIWLHLELVPKTGGAVDQLTLLARTIEVEAVTILGLPGNLARGLGLLGLFVSTVSGYPFIQRLAEPLWKRRKETGPDSPANPKTQTDRQKQILKI